MKKTAVQELKESFREIKESLPPLWIDKYINTFHSRTRGMAVAQVDRTLKNISKGQAAPTPKQLENIKSLIISK